MNYIFTALISYLFGSFNTAYFLGKAKGFDIRERGSHNAGASNIKVNLGWGAAILTGLADMFKAILSILLCSYLFPDDPLISFLAGAMAVVGHIFPFYMDFKGGKGYASYLGMLLGLDYKIALLAMALTVILSLLSNYIAIGTYAALLVVPVCFILKGESGAPLIVLILVSALIAFKHRVNIRRILRHEEIGIREKKEKH